MQFKLTKLLAGAATIALVPTQALAGGFAIGETGSRWAGRANAATALSDSPIAVHYNPANLTALSGFNFEAGASVVIPSFEYTDLAGQTTDTAASVGAPPNAAVSYTLQDFAGDMDLSFGLGFSVPYGSTFSWPDDWVGRTSVRSIRLTGYEIAPVIGFRPHEKFAIGGGLRIMPMGLSLDRAVLFGSALEGSAELAGSGTAFGAVAGATYWPVDGLAIGVAWRSAATLNATGNANFDFPAPFDTSAVDPELKGSLPLPQILRAGVAYDVIPGKLNVSADFQYQFWDRYQSLDITFINPDGSESTTSDPRNSMNSFLILVGGQYAISDSFQVRAGYVFDQKTQPEEVIGPAPPDSNRHVIDLGASYFFDNFGIHAHFADVIFVEREALTSQLPGTWRGGHLGGATAFIFSLGFSGQFGGDAAPAQAEETEATPQTENKTEAKTEGEE